MKAIGPTDAIKRFKLSTPYRVTAGLCICLSFLALIPELRGHQAADDAKSFSEIYGKAEKGDAAAQCEIAAILADGRLGVAKDETEAVKWYQKAAEQGFPPAQYRLGYCYLAGEGIKKDHAQAVEWLRKAADQNDAGAQEHLGLCYAHGAGVTTNYVEANKWYRKAAEQGFAAAQCDLAGSYARGEGVQTNNEEAAKWFRKAAEQNYPNGQYWLGVCYDLGKGVPQDLVEAAKWYGRAAERGVPLAQYQLSVCYAKGKGVRRDYVEAYKWAELASAQNNGAAKKIRAGIEERMSKEQIAEGRRRAHDFKPREGEPDGAATQSQPDRSKTNLPSGAAGSGR